MDRQLKGLVDNRWRDGRGSFFRWGCRGLIDSRGKFGRWIFRIRSLPARCVHRKASPLRDLPTWRYRVLKTALRLRPRRALSSASGQNQHFKTPAFWLPGLCSSGLLFLISWSIRVVCEQAVVGLQTQMELGNGVHYAAAGGYKSSQCNQRAPDSPDHGSASSGGGAVRF